VIFLNSYSEEFLKDFRKRLIKECIDIFILAELSEGKSMSGFDFLTLLHKKFGIVLSSGTVYSKLYSLERQGLLQGNIVSKKMVYSVSKKGQEIMQIITMLNLKIQEFLEILGSSRV